MLHVNDLRKSKNAGQFTLGVGREIYGELTVAGAESLLHLYDRQEFETHAGLHQHITGILHDLTKVSLFNCLAPLVPGYGRTADDKYHFADVFPHFVISGDRFLAPDEKAISKLHFVVDDATTLFYDFDAFGILLDSQSFIHQIVAANSKVAGRTIETGPAPQILYFTGKSEIFATDTVIGRVSAAHNPVPMTLGGPDGVCLANRIVLTIEFPAHVVFDQSIRHLATMLRFLETLAGRPQNLTCIKVTVESAHQTPVTLDVYWSMQPKRLPRPGAKGPHPADVLLDPIRRRDEFCRVLAGWLERDDSWRDARSRFSNCLAKEHFYDIDRLIGAANMFDILPPTAVPSDEVVPKELEDAKEASAKAFRKLPRTAERDSVLNALGRVGKATLKHKVRHRADIILKAMGSGFSDLKLVTDEAVNCRNFYVHGGDASFDYNGNFDAVTFFTQTLEFVFAASDLIEAGWDIQAWCKTWSSMSNSFARYKVDYRNELQELKTLLS
jgi:hypothetical protein